MNGVYEGAEMNGVYEGAEMTDSAGTDEGTDMDAAAAAAIIADAGDRARNRIQPRHRVIFTVWGVLWLFGYGVTGWSSAGSSPFTGPRPPRTPRPP